ncbi:MAG: hypothetical protein LCH39_01940 [Proteobacteria bacterium]|nr:hypothetical protein [Pseudomonadota bacterium]
MTSRSSIFQKWLRDQEASRKAAKHHRGQRQATRTFQKTTLAMLKHELDHRQIAPARAGKAARTAEHPNLFGDQP